MPKGRKDYKKSLMSFRFDEYDEGHTKEDFLKLVEDSGKNASQFIRDKLFAKNGIHVDYEPLIVAIIEQFILLNIEYNEKYGHSLDFSDDFSDEFWNIIKEKFVPLAKNKIKLRGN